MAASSSAAATSDYDVFINHRGPDVKKKFASHLYRRLLSYNLRVFLDQSELERGDYFDTQIEGAIRSASVHVAIFSTSYAESVWCLNELLLMLDSKAPIVPVFYDVKPHEVRWTWYAQHIQRLEKKRKYDPQTQEEKLRHDSATVENWRRALSLVAGISGFELDACNGYELNTSPSFMFDRSYIDVSYSLPQFIFF